MISIGKDLIVLNDCVRHDLAIVNSTIKKQKTIFDHVKELANSHQKALLLRVFILSRVLYRNLETKTLALTERRHDFSSTHG